MSDDQKRKHSSRACLECRKRHTKCDGKNICNNCTSNNRSCHYVTSKRGGFRIPKSVIQQQQQQQQQHQQTHPNHTNTSSSQVQSGYKKGNTLSSRPLTDFPYPTPKGYSPPAEESSWERLIRIYYDFFHEKYPMLPPRESKYLDNLVVRDDIQAVLSMIANVYAGDNDPSPESGGPYQGKLYTDPQEAELIQRHALEMKRTVESAPNDLIKLQALVLGAVVCQMTVLQPQSIEMRNNAIDLVVSNRLKSGRVHDMTSYSDTVHELFVLDVMLSAANGCQRSRLAALGYMGGIPEPLTEEGRVRFQVTNLIDRVIQKHEPEQYFRGVISSWEEILKHRAIYEAPLIFAYMCVSYCQIMIDLPKSTLCQPQYPTVLCAPQPQNGTHPCEVEIPETGDDSRTRSCIRAANNIVKLAMHPSLPPLACCAVGMAMLVLIKAYDLLSTSIGPDDLARKLELQIISANVTKCAQTLDGVGKLWPLPAYLNYKMRDVIMKNLPELYPTIVGSTNSVGGLTPTSLNSVQTPQSSTSSMSMDSTSHQQSSSNNMTGITSNNSSISSSGTSSMNDPHHNNNHHAHHQHQGTSPLDAAGITQHHAATTTTTTPLSMPQQQQTPNNGAGMPLPPALDVQMDNVFSSVGMDFFQMLEFV